MADLETKLLNGDIVGYCSSSDEDDMKDDKVDNTSKKSQYIETTAAKQFASRNYRNTGPKGVLEDYRICKAQTEKEESKKYEQIVAQAKMCTLLGESESENLEDIRRKRLQEMKDHLYAMRKIDELTEKEQFLSYIEANRDRWVLIHIYGEENEGCITLNKLFNTLAVHYPHLKLAKVLPQTIGMSSQFRMKALPTLQVYRNESLVGNFIRITDQLGEKFTMDQLIHFLSKNEIALDMTRYPTNAGDNYAEDDVSFGDDY